MLSHDAQITHWLAEDRLRRDALQLAAGLALPDWCIAAGFVRNLVWDRLHGYHQTTPLNDLDLVYYDPRNTEKDRDQHYERELVRQSALPWSVKNQARMHRRNNDAPYQDCADAISYWVEVETAIGAFVTSANDIKLVAPFGLDSLFAGTISYNKKRKNLPLFYQRVSAKRWLSRWPALSINVS